MNYNKFFYTELRLYTDDHKKSSYCKTTCNNQAAVTYHCFLSVCPSGKAKGAWATCVHLKFKLSCLPLEVRQVKIPKGAEPASTESQWSTELGGSAIASLFKKNLYLKRFAYLQSLYVWALRELFIFYLYMCPWLQKLWRITAVTKDFLLTWREWTIVFPFGERWLTKISPKWTKQISQNN